jgi:branched-chain amino acid transport system substrate-binding protein
VALATVLVVAAVVAASGGASSAGTAKRPAKAPAVPAWAKVLHRYTGGKLGKATGSPIAVGWVNDDGGVVQSPESTAAVKVALNVINNYLGGGNGHRLVLHGCSIVSGEEQGQTCAQQLLNDSAVKFVNEGVVTVGAGAFHQTLQGRKPVIGFNPVRIESATAKNTYEMTAGLFGTDPGFVGYLYSILHAKTVSLLNPGDDPAGVQAAKTFVEQAKGLGINVTQVPYQSAATDLVGPLTAARAQSTDATVMFLVSTPACVAGYRAASQLHVKHVLSLALCLIPDVAKNLGDFPKWTYVATNESAQLPKADPYVGAWLTAMKKYGAKNISPFPQLAFASIMTDAKILNQIGKGANFTSDQFAAKLKAFHGPVMFGPTRLDWGSVPGLPALGTATARLYTYQGHGKWIDATKGKWVGLPKK